MLLNIDYLKLFVKCNKAPSTNGYTKKLMPYSSRHYKKIEILYMGDFKLGILESQPHSSILDPQSGMLKIENKILYAVDSFNFINLTLEIFNLEIVSISRLDLALDFVKFKNNLKPNMLIKRYMNEKLLRNGRGKFTIIGNQTNVQDVEYLRFGSKSSDINIYLYNKTREMEEVRYKEYIADRWEKLENKNNNDIWRLEVSLSSQGLHYADEESGEIIKINYNLIQDENILKKLYQSLILKYFEFKINDNTKNKSRMKTLQLFDFKNISMHKIKISEKRDITRQDKILLKKMYQFDRKYSTASRVSKSSASIISRELQKDRYLEQYLNRKKHHWDNEDID